MFYHVQEFEVLTLPLQFEPIEILRQPIMGENIKFMRAHMYYDFLRKNNKRTEMTSNLDDKLK